MNWQSRIWKLIGRLVLLASDEGTDWPSPDKPDHLAEDANFMRGYRSIVEQV